MDRRAFLTATVVLATLSTVGRGQDMLTTVNLRVSLGQSNALAAGGSAALAPLVGVGLMFAGNPGTIRKFNEPIGRGGSQGDAWAAYCNEEYSQNCIPTLWVQCAVGGTSLLPLGEANGDWSPTGALRYNAVAKINLALSAIAASDRYRLGQIEIVWIQGEQDGTASVSRAAYAVALTELVEWLYDQLPDLAMFNIIRLGQNARLHPQRGWADVRGAQEDVAAAMPEQVRMLYRGTFSAQAMGLQPMDSPHYNQIMLNMAGTCAARERYTEGPLALLDPPQSLGNQSVVGRTMTFTTAAGARCLIIAVHGGNGTAPTVNGISALAIHRSGPVYLWVVDENTYGGPLTEVAVTVNASADHVAVKQLDALYMPDAIYTGTRFLNRPKNGPINLYGLTTGHPSLVVYASTGTGGFVFDESSEAEEVTEKVYAPTGATVVVGAALRRQVSGEHF